MAWRQVQIPFLKPVLRQPTLQAGFLPWAKDSISQPQFPPQPPAVQMRAPYPFPVNTSGQPGIRPLPGTISQPTTIPYPQQPNYPYPFPVNASGQPGIRPLPGTISQPTTIPYPQQPGYPYPFPLNTSGQPGISPSSATISQPTLAPNNPQLTAAYPFPVPSTVPVVPTGFASWASRSISQPLNVSSQPLQPGAMFVPLVVKQQQMLTLLGVGC